MIRMLRVIFDTNIYGLLATEPGCEGITKRIQSDEGFIVYGYAPIRREIRDIPKKTKMSRKVRVQLLGIYDRITGHHVLNHSTEIAQLAKKYYDHYRYLGGTYGCDTNIRIDFMIVACASFHGMDLVYSSDKKTMLGEQARKAYHHINIQENLRTPYFLKFAALLEKFKDYNL